MIIHVLFSFLSPFSCDLLGWRMFAEASLEEFRPCASCAFPVRSTVALFSPSSVLNGPTLRVGGGGALNVSVEMTLRGDKHISFLANNVL